MFQLKSSATHSCFIIMHNTPCLICNVSQNKRYRAKMLSYRYDRCCSCVEIVKFILQIVMFGVSMIRGFYDKGSRKIRKPNSQTRKIVPKSIVEMPYSCYLVQCPFRYFGMRKHNHYAILQRPQQKTEEPVPGSSRFLLQARSSSAPRLIPPLRLRGPRYRSRTLAA